MEIRQVAVRKTIIGKGRTKICLPITGKSKEEIIEQAKKIASFKQTDLVEWRADYLDVLFDEEGKIDEETLLTVGKSIRDSLKNIPVLFTFRTKEEGGEREITNFLYQNLNGLAIQSGYFDLIDLELTKGDKLISEVIRRARSYHVAVIVSSHDFEKTPPSDELIYRMNNMQRLGADICKIAVMPENKRDVIRLLQVTYVMREQYAKVPLITMSMGKTGAISRMVGEYYGSCVTFGTLGNASAPGQVEALKLAAVLQVVHENEEQENLK